MCSRRPACCGGLPLRSSDAYRSESGFPLLTQDSFAALLPYRVALKAAKMRYVILSFKVVGFGEGDFFVADFAGNLFGYNLGAGIVGHGTPPSVVLTLNQTSPVHDGRQASSLLC